MSGLSLKLHSPTFPHLFPPCLSLLPLLSYSNGLALFTQQHAICSKARWSDLGGMLRGLKEYEYFTRWLVCAKEEEGTERIQACLCAMWVWAEERERERGSADTSDASRTETVLLEMTCYTRLQEFIAGSKFIPRSQLLYGPCMSSLTAAVFTSRLDWYRKSRPLSCRRVFFLLLLRLSSRPYAANNASAWKVYPPPPPLPPSSASTSVERWQEVSLFYCLRFCGSLFHTPALHVHGDQRCCSLCNCAD